MKWSYLFKHWIGTLLLGSLAIVRPKNMNFNSSVFYEIQDIFLNFVFVTGIGLIISVPTFLLCALLFKIASEKSVNTLATKLLIILTTIFGIFLTFLLIFDSFFVDATSTYVLAALISGMVFKLKKSETPKEQTISKN